MNIVLALLGFALLFAAFGALRLNHRCNNCGGCTAGCRAVGPEEDTHV
jgi:heterodisulfide reductase subunit C